MTGSPTPRHARIPALDGLRGGAMLLFMLYHFGVTALQGAWTGINLFFVLSGYLIVSIVMRRQALTGQWNLGLFYRSRARRLLPALAVVIAVVALWGMAEAGDSTRRGMRGDAAATSFFVMNWRLISKADQYFADDHGLSFFRHAWTLSVEEQFYILAPLLLMVLVTLGTKRRMLIAVAVLTAASAIWTVHVGVGTAASNAHAYYGTDTRVQSILVGVALALWWHGTTPHEQRTRLERVGPGIAAGGLAVVVASFVFVEPMSPWFFERGGLLLYSVVIAGLVAVLAAGCGGLVQRFLDAPILVWLGVRSYGLYLWHWPVKVWLDWYFPQAPVPAAAVAGTAATLIVAGLSFRLLEEPVLRRGLQGLPGRGSGRVMAAISVTAVAVLVVSVGNVATPVPSAKSPSLIPGQRPYVATASPVKVVMMGDSVPFYLTEDLPAETYSDLRVANHGEPGCWILGWALHVSDALTYERSPKCVAQYQNVAAESAGTNAVVYLADSTFPLQFQLPSGGIVDAGDTKFRKELTSELDALRTSVTGAKSQLVVVTAPCRDPEFAGVTAENKELISGVHRDRERARSFVDPVATNALVTEWAHAHDVPVLDLYRALGCEQGYRSSIHGVTVYRDFFHFTPEAARMVWTWLAPAVRDIAVANIG